MATSRGTSARFARISAHKGGSEQAPAATYEAYQDSLMTGAEYVEFDIRRTRDQALVTYHDDAAGPAGRRVRDLGYAELCDLAGYRVPLLEDVMRLLAGRTLGHLDLKETGYEKEVIALALATFGPGNFVATSLDDAVIVAIKRSFPLVTTALSLGRNLGGVPTARGLSVRTSELLPLSRIRACGADWVAVNYKLARFGVISACRRAGIGVMVWTVDSDRLIDKYLTDHRVDVLITDRPRYAVQRRAGLSRPGVRSPG